jgi:hypothetical protein
MKVRLVLTIVIDDQALPAAVEDVAAQLEEQVGFISPGTFYLREDNADDGYTEYRVNPIPTE